MDELILRIENLIKYHNDFSLKIPTLKFINGRIYSIIGPNGSGKTTLLNLLGLLDKPEAGKIFFKEEEIDGTYLSLLNARRKIHLVMENPVLFSTTVFKNISFGLKIRSVDKKIIPATVKESLEMVGLDGFEKKIATRLSRGETQRAAIARAIALKPELLLLDEPFANVDQRNVNAIEALIKTINQKYKTTIIFTTHDLSQAYRLSDEVITLLDGKTIEGSLENFFPGEINEVNGLKQVEISPSVKISVVTEKIGKGHISINPRDIILSHSHLQSSARNTFKGIIKKIQLENNTVRVYIEVIEGIKFTALITKKSCEEMNLSIGSNIFLTFKTTEVMVF